LGRQSSPAQREEEDEDEEGEQNGIPQRTRETARDRDSSDRRFSTRSGKICVGREELLSIAVFAVFPVFFLLHLIK